MHGGCRSASDVVFSWMRSKGSRFTPGVWGLRVCSLDVAFTFATVRNRPRYCFVAVPMVSSAEGVVFGGFKRRVSSFRVAGVALRDIQTCIVTCRKPFCVAGAIFYDVFRRCVAVFVAGAALWTRPASFCVGGSYPGDGSQSHKYIYFVILCCCRFFLFVFLSFQFCLSFCLSLFFVVSALFVMLLSFFSFSQILAYHLFGVIFSCFCRGSFCLSFFLVIDRKNYIFRIFARIAPQNCK